MILRDGARVKYASFSPRIPGETNNYYSGSKIIASAMVSDIYEVPTRLKVAGSSEAGKEDYIPPIDKWSQSPYWEKVGDPIKKNIDRFLYLRSRAVSSEEGYGANANRDAFPASDLRERFHSLIGAQIFVDHDNRDWTKLLGAVKDAVYIHTPEVYQNSGWADALQVCDIRRTNRLYRGLVPLIVTGRVTDVSMGCITNYSLCSRCGAVITARKSCSHLIDKTKKLVAGKLPKDIYERVQEFLFFELSFITTGMVDPNQGGADPLAKIEQKFASIIRNPERKVEYGGGLIDSRDYDSIEKVENLREIQSRVDSISDKYKFDPEDDSIGEILKTGATKIAYYYIHNLPVDSIYNHKKLEDRAVNKKVASVGGRSYTRREKLIMTYNILSRVLKSEKEGEKLAFDPSIEWSSGHFLQTKLSVPPKGVELVHDPLGIDIVGLPQELDDYLGEDIKETDKQNILGLITMKDSEEIEVNIEPEQVEVTWEPRSWREDDTKDLGEELNSDFYNKVDSIFSDDLWNNPHAGGLLEEEPGDIENPVPTPSQEAKTPGPAPLLSGGGEAPPSAP